MPRRNSTLAFKKMSASHAQLVQSTQLFRTRTRIRSKRPSNRRQRATCGLFFSSAGKMEASWGAGEIKHANFAADSPLRIRCSSEEKSKVVFEGHLYSVDY